MSQPKLIYIDDVLVGKTDSEISTVSETVEWRPYQNESRYQSYFKYLGRDGNKYIFTGIIGEISFETGDTNALEYLSTLKIGDEIKLQFEF